MLRTSSVSSVKTNDIYRYDNHVCRFKLLYLSMREKLLEKSNRGGCLRRERAEERKATCVGKKL